MTDEELITRLRLQAGQQNLIAKSAMLCAADRIQELVKERDAALVLLGVAADNIRSLHRAETAEVKLAKAVDIIKQIIATAHADDYVAWDRALDDGIDFTATLEKPE